VLVPGTAGTSFTSQHKARSQAILHKFPLRDMASMHCLTIQLVCTALTLLLSLTGLLVVLCQVALDEFEGAGSNEFGREIGILKTRLEGVEKVSSEAEDTTPACDSAFA
jgi:hypothetical protein